MLNIIIDDRENKLKKIVQTNSIIKYTIQRLLIGDIIINDSIIIERKTLYDLSSSIKDKRIYNQETALLKSNKHICFIIEGNIEEYIMKATQPFYHLLPSKSILTKIRHLSESYKVFRTKNILDTLNTIEITIPLAFGLW